MGKKWQIAYADYSWGQSTKAAYAAEIKKNGGEVTGTIGIPLGTADMTPFLSKISGDFDGLFLIFFGPDAIRIVTQSYDLGLLKKYKFAGDGAIAVSAQLPALGDKIEGFVGIDRYVPVFDPPLDTPHLHAFLDAAVDRLKKAGLSGAAPPILATEGLAVRFGGLRALDNVNLAVAQGEIRAIIGPNGAGKSTLFNCLTGVLRPTAGHIRFAGDDITGLSPDRISQKGIARSYQITNILPNATVL